MVLSCSNIKHCLQNRSIATGKNKANFLKGVIGDDAAYQAYGAVTDFKNFRGEPMPAYEDLPETIKEAWISACKAVLRLEGETSH